MRSVGEAGPCGRGSFCGVRWSNSSLGCADLVDAGMENQMATDIEAAFGTKRTLSNTLIGNILSLDAIYVSGIFMDIFIDKFQLIYIIF